MLVEIAYFRSYNEADFEGNNENVEHDDDFLARIPSDQSERGYGEVEL